ncbi:MAG: hypothetical protein WCK49_06930 [Myxococcaceae bacterium]
MFILCLSLSAQGNDSERFARILQADPEFIFKCIREGLTPLVVQLAQLLPVLVSETFMKCEDGCYYTAIGYAVALAQTDMIEAFRKARTSL